MLRTALLGALAFACAATAHAAEAASRCTDASIPKGVVAERGGKWIELTRDQWQFLRGIYAMHPQTPAGLPYGDRAALATSRGNPGGGVVFFIDGEEACTPMPIPRDLIEMMSDVAAGVFNHEATEPSN